ncbi:MAG: hypothetical protein QM813_17965 [Verrucomicrobiota bacterium]
MVKSPTRLLPAALLLTTLLSASAKELTDYRIGDRIEADVITPLPLMVVDPAATEVLKDKEAQRIPVLFRYDKSAAISVEADLRDKYSLARSNFLFLMHSSFHHTRLEEDQIATEQFDKLIASFQKRDKLFPLTDALATEWALGRDGLAEQIKMIARVRQAMDQPIRYDNLTNAPKIGSRITLIPVKSAAENLNLEAIQSRGQSINKTNLQTMSRARLALREQFSAAEEEAAKFAARCLVENCFVETELTQAARTRQTEALFVADSYQAGQTIARQGQLVDRKIMAALSQLQEKTVAGRLQQQVVHEQSQVAQIRERTRWLVGTLIAAAALFCGALAWFLLRNRKPASLLPALVTPNPTTPPVTDFEWQQRALAAEQKVAQAHEAIRSGVMAQLKDKAVTSLAAQRSDMLEAQHAAAVEMAELEKRLNELQAPLQDRLRAYENRITDLEKALAAKGDENRELIRAKIELMRKQLEAERARDLQFN